MPRVRTRVALPYLLLLAFVLVVAACDDTAPVNVVSGTITEVDSASVVEWASIVVETRDGERFTFQRGDSVDLRFWRSSHLRDHMLSGSRVEVTYEIRNGDLVATGIGDAKF
jgi:hypothetical protein